MKVKAKGLDHVAIAVKDLDRAIGFYRSTLGLELAEVEEVPEQQVKAAIFGRGMGRIELIHPTSHDSSLARFLDKRGEGLHHICIEVEDLDAALAELAARGVARVDAPEEGANGARVAFIHPKGTGGVLVELRQAKPVSG